MKKVLALIAMFGMVASITGFANVTKAGNMASVNDVTTRQEVSTASDHEINFILPAGIDFDVTGNTDVITVDFDESSAFTTTGTWATGDFVFEIDGVAQTILTVTAGAGAQSPNCTGTSGNDEIAVTVNTTTLAFGFSGCGTFTASQSADPISVQIAGSAGDGVLTNPSSADSYFNYVLMDDEGSSSAHTGGFSTPIVGDDTVDITADVSSSFTYDVDETAACDDPGSFTDDDASNITLPLGNLVPNTVTTSGVGGIDYICIENIDTTASGGAVFSVLSLNNGLLSGSDLIENTNEDLDSANEEGFGICVESVDEGSGTGMAIAGSFNTDCDTTGGNSVQDLSTSTWTQFANTQSDPVTDGVVDVMVKAVASTNTPAHSDYAESLTFRGVGTF